MTTEGVLLLHGIARTSASMRTMQRAMEREGYAVLNLDYRSRHRPLDGLAASIDPAVSRFADAVPSALNVVAHSMGGLLARMALARHRPARLGRVVMLGTPNGGSEVADALRGLALYRFAFGPAGQQLATAQDDALRMSLGNVTYPLGTLAGDRPLNPIAARMLLSGPKDRKVAAASTRLVGMIEHRVVATSHTRLVSHPDAVAATLRFLRGARLCADP